MGWSRLGASKMAELRAYWLNGGDMLELARYQREELPLAAGAEEYQVLSAHDIEMSERSRHGKLGKYVDAITYCEMPLTFKKRLAIQHHIAGL